MPALLPKKDVGSCDDCGTEVIDFEPKKGRRDFPQVKLLLGPHLASPTIS